MVRFRGLRTRKNSARNWTDERSAPMHPTDNRRRCELAWTVECPCVRACLAVEVSHQMMSLRRRPPRSHKSEHDRPNFVIPSFLPVHLPVASSYISNSNATGLSAATTAKLRKDLTTLAHNRVFPVVVEIALYGTRLRRGILTVSRTLRPVP